jgi:hypothetical protein
MPTFKAILVTAAIVVGTLVVLKTFKIESKLDLRPAA